MGWLPEHDLDAAYGPAEAPNCSLFPQVDDLAFGEMNSLNIKVQCL